MNEIKLEFIGNKEEFKRIKSLYKEAFPKEERAPIWLIRRTLKRKTAQMLVATAEGRFIGFAYMVCNRKLAYIFYLALEEEERGKGYGSAVLEAMKERYRGKKLFLAREKLDSKAENYEQRCKRHQFYLKNGFEDLTCQIKEASVVFDAMGIGGEVSAAEYEDLIVNWGGKRLVHFIDMRVIEADR